MIKSMTGFGRSEYNDGKRNVVAEIRAVNHRYSEITIRMPRRYTFAEEKLKNVVRSIIKRGKIDVSINVENIKDDDVKIRLNETLAKQYIENIGKLKEITSINGELDIKYIAGLPEVLKITVDIADEEEALETLKAPLLEAAKRLDEMRIAEGHKLAEDIIKRGNIIKELAKKIEVRAPEMLDLYREKLRMRINELLEKNTEISEERLALECAIFSDRSNTTEEIVRLDSHISQLNKIISESSQPDGKKLDFLIQEMNRECNTIGSKANDLAITDMVVEMKSEIEKIREQVQNIE